MKLKKNKELRSLAKERLSGCWCECTGSLLIFSAVIIAACLTGILIIRFLYTYGIIGFDTTEIFTKGTPLFFVICVCAAILLIIGMIPLKYGICWYYAQAAEGRNVPAYCIFSCYMHPKHMRQTLKLGLSVWAYRLVGLVPAGAFIAFCGLISLELLRKNDNILLNTVLLALVLLLATAVLFIYIVYSMRYELVPYIYAAYPDKSVSEIMKFSVKCTDGTKLYLIKTMFSFIPWVILCVMVFPIIYVVPYMGMTFAVAVSDIIAEETDSPDAEADIDGVKETDHAFV